MPDPVFSAEDRVNDPSLPAELVGKSPAEIAKYYRDREQRLVDKANQMIRDAGTPKPGSVTIVQPTTPTTPPAPGNITREEAERLVAPARPALIAAAKMAASQGKPYWTKYVGEIERVMEGVAVDEQMQQQTWETAYYSVVGLHTQEIEAEARKAASTPVGAEPPVAAPTPAPAPVDLSKLVHLESGKSAVDVCNGLGVSQDQYRESMQRIDKGVWPLTRESVGRR